MSMKDLLSATAEHARHYLETLDDRPVFPPAEAIAGLAELAEPLPEAPLAPEAVLACLAEIVAPATVASAGRRYFGFVTGGSLPAALAANWLAGAWDQNGGLSVMSPGASHLE